MSPTDRYVFGLDEGEEALDPTFAAEAAFFDPTKRCGRVGYQSAVEADHAGLNSLADPQASSEVGGVDVGPTARGRVIERVTTWGAGRGPLKCQGKKEGGREKT